MSKGRTRQTTTSSGTMNQTSNATGTPFAQNLLGQIGSQDVLGQVFQANDGYSGPREATLNIPTNVGGEWGALPQTFVPQHTTGNAPQAQQQTAVDINYRPGIEAGINNANAQAGQLQAISDAGLAGVQTAIGSPHQGLDEMLNALRTQHNITSAQQTQNLAEVAGQQGAFGGTSFARDNAMQTGELQRAFDNQAAQLLWADQGRRDQWLRDGAGVAGSFAGVADLTPQRLLNYGNLGLANQQNIEDINFANRTADANNAFTAGQLVDTNRDRAAQDAIAAWEAAFNVSDQNARNSMVRAALEQGNAQTGLNNQYYNWASDQEALDQMLNRLQMLMGTAASAPGGSTSGTSNETSTTTTRQSQSALATLGSILGAGMQFGGAGGFGSITGAGAGLAGAGAGAAGAGGAASAISSILPFIFASERRLKENIVPLFESRKGIRWYAFNYKNNNEPQTGVMEDEVRYIPGAVKIIDGVNHVDYNVISRWEAA